LAHNKTVQLGRGMLYPINTINIYKTLKKNVFFFDIRTEIG